MGDLKTKPTYSREAMAPEGECAYCDKLRKEGATFFPYHDASMNCPCGRRPHCTCDICF